jgi:hypothetical protein
MEKINKLQKLLSEQANLVEKLHLIDSRMKRIKNELKMINAGEKL